MHSHANEFAPKWQRKKIVIFFINFIMNHLYVVLLHILQWIVQLIFLKEW